MQDNEEYKKDYSLLRPFDLEKAKNGELVSDEIDTTIWSYVAGSDTGDNYILLINNSEYMANGEFTYPCKSKNLRMKPLCWVEGKPVYKGDVLYWYGSRPFKFVVGNKIICEDILQGYSYDSNGNLVYGEYGNSGVSPSDLTWNKPKRKEKRTVWINVYPDDLHTIYSSKEEADVSAYSPRIACVETEIEYEV